jgi:hypothetical protein
VHNNNVVGSENSNNNNNNNNVMYDENVSRPGFDINDRIVIPKPFYFIPRNIRVHSIQRQI